MDKFHAGLWNQQDCEHLRWCLINIKDKSESGSIWWRISPVWMNPSVKLTKYWPVYTTLDVIINVKGTHRESWHESCIVFCRSAKWHQLSNFVTIWLLISWRLFLHTVPIECVTKCLEEMWGPDIVCSPDNCIDRSRKCLRFAVSLYLPQACVDGLNLITETDTYRKSSTFWEMC